MRPVSLHSPASIFLLFISQMPHSRSNRTGGRTGAQTVALAGQTATAWPIHHPPHPVRASSLPRNSCPTVAYSNRSSKAIAIDDHHPSAMPILQAFSSTAIAFPRHDPPTLPLHKIRENTLNCSGCRSLCTPRYWATEAPDDKLSAAALAAAASYSHTTRKPIALTSEYHQILLGC